jgi:hypothetical protein
MPWLHAPSAANNGEVSENYDIMHDLVLVSYKNHRSLKHESHFLAISTCIKLARSQESTHVPPAAPEKKNPHLDRSVAAAEVGGAEH